MNIERLQQLRDYIAELPTHAVDLGVYLKTEADRYDTDETESLRIAKEESCNTVGCIAGYACMIMPREFLVTVNAYSSLGKQRIDIAHERSAKSWLEMGETENSHGLFAERRANEKAATDREVALARLDFAIQNGGRFNAFEFRRWLDLRQ